LCTLLVTSSLEVVQLASRDTSVSYNLKLKNYKNDSVFSFKNKTSYDRLFINLMASLLDTFRVRVVDIDSSTVDCLRVSRVIFSLQ